MTADLGAESSLAFLDSLYLDVLQSQGYPDSLEADKTHTYILGDRSPLNVLLYLNTILVGIHIL